MPAEGSQQLSLPLEIGTEGWLVKGMNHLQLFSVLSEFVRDAAAEFVLDALSQRVQESLPVAPIVAEDPLYEVDDLVQLLVLVLERQEHQVVRNGQLYWAASRGDHFMSGWLVVVVGAGLDHDCGELIDYNDVRQINGKEQHCDDEHNLNLPNSDRKHIEN